MNLNKNDIPVFSITLKDIQSVAMEKIGRELCDEEINIVKKGMGCG